MKVKHNFEYFKISEFSCKCCGKNKISLDFIEMLDKARNFSGVPFNISSGYRCFKHNKSEGGSATSSHLKGIAADILVRDDYCRLKIVQGTIKAGFTRLGVSKKYIHVDSDNPKGDCLFLSPKNKIKVKKEL